MGSKDSPDPPRAPDPNVTSAAQAQANQQAIYDSARVNRYDQTTPYGSVTWNRPTDDPSTWSQNVTLDPAYQQRLDQENQLGNTVLHGANYRAWQLPKEQFSTEGLPELQSGLDQSQLPAMQSSYSSEGLPQLQGSVSGQYPELRTGLNTEGLQELPTDFSSDAQRLESATYDRAMGLMNPEFDRQQKQLENRLVQQGIPIGSEAYNDEMGRFEKSRNEAQLAAALDSVGAGRQEQSRMFDVNQRARQQGVNEQLYDANLGMDARGQLFGEGVTNAGLSNTARSQGMNERLQAADFANQARQQGVAEQGQDFSMAQAARQQGVSDRQLERNQAYNELAMLMGQNPSMQTMNAPQTAQYQMAAPDRMGAEQLAYQGNLNNYNQQMNNNQAKKTGTTGLIGTLGGAAIDKWG